MNHISNLKKIKFTWAVNLTQPRMGTMKNVLRKWRCSEKAKVYCESEGVLRKWCPEKVVSWEREGVMRKWYPEKGKVASMASNTWPTEFWLVYKNVVPGPLWTYTSNVESWIFFIAILWNLSASELLGWLSLKLVPGYFLESKSDQLILTTSLVECQLV